MFRRKCSSSRDYTTVHRFIEEEGLKLDNAIDKCQALQTTLHNLNQYAVVQIHRTPMIPYFATEEEPDREALMENIQSIYPNHRHRAKEIKKAEVIIQRRKEFTSSTKQELKQFESDLRTQRQSLKHVRRFSDIESHQLMKAKEVFLKEKDVRRKQMEEELQMQGRLAVRKRENERRQFEEFLRWQQRGSKALTDELPAPGLVQKSKATSQSFHTTTTMTTATSLAGRGTESQSTPLVVMTRSCHSCSLQYR